MEDGDSDEKHTGLSTVWMLQDIVMLNSNKQGFMFIGVEKNSLGKTRAFIEQGTKPGRMMGSGTKRICLKEQDRWLLGAIIEEWGS